MAFAAAAIPWIIAASSAAGTGYSIYSAHKAGQASDDALALQRQQGDRQAQYGQTLLNEGLPYTRQAGNYFQTLLRGDRAALSNAVAGPRASITDLYRGAERGLDQQGVRGASRDQAAGELNRQKVGQLSQLVSGVQPLAAQQLSGLGGNLITGGGNLVSGAAGTYGNVAQGAFARSQYADQSTRAWGSMLFDLVNGVSRTKTQPGSGMGNTGYPPNDTNGWG